MGPNGKPPLRCTICEREIEARPQNGFFPFCSVRCRQVDLGRWLGEEYRVANRHVEDDEDGELGPEPRAGDEPPNNH